LTRKTNRSLQGRINLAKIALEELGDKKMHRTDWNVLCRIGNVRFNNILKFLMDNNYVERIARGVYCRTEKGKKFCEL